MTAAGWLQPATTRRPHRDKNAGSDAHQQSFTRVGDRPKAVLGSPNRLARLLTPALAQSQCRLRSSSALDDVVRMHYNEIMKTAVIPQVRVEPELRADLDSVLLPGETLTEFVEASVRRAVEFRRVQTDFAARCDASLAAYERTGVSIPSDVVLSKLEAKVAARVKQLRK